MKEDGSGSPSPQQFNWTRSNMASMRRAYELISIAVSAVLELVIELSTYPSSLILPANFQDLVKVIRSCYDLPVLFEDPFWPCSKADGPLIEVWVFANAAFGPVEFTSTRFRRMRRDDSVENCRGLSGPEERWHATDGQRLRSRRIDLELRQLGARLGCSINGKVGIHTECQAGRPVGHSSGVSS